MIEENVNCNGIDNKKMKNDGEERDDKYMKSEEEISK